MSNCESCGHPLAQHFTDVTGVARCLHVHSGVSTSGIIGMPWSHHCDCENMRSERAVRRAAEEEIEKAKREREMEELRQRFKERNALRENAATQSP